MDRAKAIDGAREFSRKATQLSEAIERFEGFLRELPGKVAAEAFSENENDAYGVTFEKFNGEWRLLLTINPGGDADWINEPLATSSIDWKSTVAHLLPTLVENLLEEQAKAIEKADAAISTLYAFEYPVRAARSAAGSEG